MSLYADTVLEFFGRIINLPINNKIVAALTVKQKANQFCHHNSKKNIIINPRLMFQPLRLNAKLRSAGNAASITTFQW